VPVYLDEGTPFSVRGGENGTKFARARINRQPINELLTKRPEKDPTYAARRVAAHKQAQAIGQNVRPRVPAPTRTPRSIQEFFEDVEPHLATHNLGRHDGYRAMEGAMPQGLEQRFYRVVSVDGGMVGKGDYGQMLTLLAKRGVEGDLIFYGQRPVAHWVAKGVRKNRIEADWLFSSPDELEFTKAFVQKNPKARPQQLRRHGLPDRMTNASGLLTARAVGPILGDYLTDAPFPRSLVRPANTPLGRVFEQAAQLTFYSHVGAHRFEFLNGAMVPKWDKPKILADAKTVMTNLGLGEYKEVLSVKQAKKIRGVAAKLGVDLGDLPPSATDPDKAQLRPDQYRKVYAAVIEDVGGAVATARYRLQGMPLLADRLQNFLASINEERRVLSPFLSGFRWWAGKLMEWALGDPLAGSPEVILLKRGRWVEMARHSADELRDELMALAKSGMGRDQAVHQLLMETTLLEPERVELAQTIKNRLRELEDEDILELRNRVRRIAKGREKKTPFLLLDDKDIPGIRDGLYRWAEAVENDMVMEAQKYLQAYHVAAIGPKAKSSLQERALIDPSTVDRKLLLRVYTQVFHQGKFDGDAVKAAFNVANIVINDPDPLHAVAQLLLRARLDRVLEEVLNEMLDEGIAFLPHVPLYGRGDPSRSPLLKAVGKRGVTRDPDGTMHTSLPASTHHMVMETLAKWGVDPFTKAWRNKARKPEVVLREEVIGGRKLLVPQHLAKQLDELNRAGVIDSRDLQVLNVDAWEVINNAYRTSKKMMRGLWFLPGPDNLLGQFLSAFPTRVATGGWTGAYRTTRSFFRHPRQVGYVMQKLADPDVIRFAPEIGDELFHTPYGPYRMDEIVKAARANGLQETFDRFETAPRFVRLLRKMEAQRLPGLSWKKIHAAGRWWNNQLLMFAGAADQMGRVATMFDELERGASLDQAAKTARNAFLDYSNLTEFEELYIRWAFTFYSFLRKNADAWTRALFRNPHWVASQGRLFLASHSMWGLSPAQLGAMDDQDAARLTLYQSDQVVDEYGRPHHWYRYNRLQSMPMGVGEFLNEIRMFFGWAIPVATWDSEEFAGGLNPFLATLLLGLSDTIPGREWGWENYKSNRVPLSLLKMPGIGWAVTELFDVGPVPLEPLDDPGMADHEATMEAGQAAYFAVGGAKSPVRTPDELRALWKKWQMVKIWSFGLFTTTDQWAKFFGIIEPGPTQTQLQEMVDLIGTTRAIPEDAEVERQHKRDKEQEIRRAAADLEQR